MIHCYVQRFRELGLAGVARHSAVDPGEGAGWTAHGGGEDAAHGAGHGQAGADVAKSLAVDTSSPRLSATLVDRVAVLGPEGLADLH